MTSPAQAPILPVMESLGFELVPPSDHIFGGPVEFRVTEDTLEFLKGKSFSILSDGTIEVL